MNFFKIILLIIVTVAIFTFIDNSQDDTDDTSYAYTAPINTKIVAFGDSITTGYRVDTNDSYPSILENLLGTEVINEGVAGESTESGLKRFPSILERYKPQIIIICEGSSDIARNKELSRTKKNLAQMIKLAKKQNVFVVLVGVPKLGILTVTTAPLYYDLAKELSVPIAGDVLQDILNDDSLRIDSKFPNAKGYMLLSKKIADIITNEYVPKM